MIEIELHLFVYKCMYKKKLEVFLEIIKDKY